MRVAAEQAAKFVAEMKAQADAVIWRGDGRIIEHIPPTGRWITFAGIYGCGKTTLARQIAAAAPKTFPNCRARNHADAACVRTDSVWWEGAELAQAMKGRWDLPEDLARYWLVVIDDLGAGRDVSGHVAEALYRIANQRLGKWTVWTSNLGRQEIANHIDARLASRLVRGRNAFVPIDAGDYADRP